MLPQLRAAGGAAATELPVPWLESQALFLLELMLQQCRTEYELGKLLQLFAAAENLLLDGKDRMDPRPSGRAES